MTLVIRLLGSLALAGGLVQGPSVSLPAAGVAFEVTARIAAPAAPMLQASASDDDTADGAESADPVHLKALIVRHAAAAGLTLIRVAGPLATQSEYSPGLTSTAGYRGPPSLR